MFDQNFDSEKKEGSIAERILKIPKIFYFLMKIFKLPKHISGFTNNRTSTIESKCFMMLEKFYYKNEINLY